MAEAPPSALARRSAISETSFEFGGALGIAVLGSILTAVYRGAMEHAGPGGHPAGGDRGGQNTLGGAVAAAKALPGESGAKLLATARDGFVYAFEITAAISAVASLIAAALAASCYAGQARDGKTGIEP